MTTSSQTAPSAAETEPRETPLALGELLSYAATIAEGRGGLVEAGESIGWAELDRRAGQLATALRRQGVQPGHRVGVHFRKSIAGFVAMHAAVRIGAIAVPLDPKAPIGYLTSVIDEVGVTVLCTHHLCARSARELVATKTPLTAVVGLDGNGSDSEVSESSVSWISPAEVDSCDEAAPVVVANDAPAYVITTSGSTGRPKGVVHTHGSAMAYVERVHRTLGLTPSDRISDVAPHHFDVSTLALWNTPFAGATAVVVPEAYQMLPASLSELVESEKLTVWYSAPFTLRQMEMRGALDQRDLSSLRWALFGGEVYPPQALARVMAHLPNAVLRNVYGPCETNWCAHYDQIQAPTDDKPIAIGTPWENTRIRLVLDGVDVDGVDVDGVDVDGVDVDGVDIDGVDVDGVDVDGVDVDGAEVEKGQQGEIWIQSPTMMRGYWQRPELDAKCFVDVEQGPDAGRWYRSGDLAHRRSDGELVFDGRLDHQVKVRGHRIELEFVEAILEDSPAIDLAVVDARRDEAGHDTLVAGVMRRDGSSSDLAAVTAHARAHLPTYAQPTRLVDLDRIQETGSGKLDRRALRAEIHQKLDAQEFNRPEPGSPELD